MTFGKNFDPQCQVPRYNQSDTATGWFHFLAGLTLYYSDPEEATLDPLYSVSMPPGTVPMLSIVQLHTIKLGEYTMAQIGKIFKIVWHTQNSGISILLLQPGGKKIKF